jgi:hypothetical protein
MRLLRIAILAALAVNAGPPALVSATSVPRRPGPYVMPCVGVTLSASYLADVSGHGPGFLFSIQNRTLRTIRLADPVPSSAHWYAHVGNRWMWRASAGWGGALVNAENSRGLMFAYQPSRPPAHPAYLIVPAHGSRQWTEAMRGHPSIAYQPGCPMCRYAGETEYQAVFAYAYLPAAAEHAPNLLRCGLRSSPVPMPPHSAVPQGR